MSGGPRILFVALIGDVGSDRIVSAMGRLGCRCAVVGPARSFAAGSRFVELVVPVSRGSAPWLAGLRLPGLLRRLAKAWAPDLIVPLDDLSARVLHDRRLLAGVGVEVRRLIETSLGTCHEIVERARTIEIAAEIGLCTPRQRRVRSLKEAMAAAEAFGYPVVLKRDGTCGGFGVAIVHDPAALEEAYRRARRIAEVKHALQRLVGLGAATHDLILQSHVTGPLAYRTVACREGRILDAISFTPVSIDPPITGASTMVEPATHPAMDAATSALIATLGCSGIVSLDFILAADGEAHLIEVNARPVATGHLGTLYGHDIYDALLASLRGDPVHEGGETPAGPKRIALFPRELARDPKGTAIEAASVYHDVPWDEPALVAAYGAWLAERRSRPRGIGRRCSDAFKRAGDRLRYGARAATRATAFDMLEGGAAPTR